MAPQLIKFKNPVGHIVPSLLFVVALFASGPILIFNIAQLQRLHGSYNQMAYNIALFFLPKSSHLRWQAGEVLLNQGHYKEASEILTPLIASAETSTSGLEVVSVIEALVRNNQISEAQNVYEKLPATAKLSRFSAAKLSLAYLKENPVNTERLVGSVSQIIDTDNTSKIDILRANSLVDLNSNLTPIGNRVIWALQVKAANQTEATKPSQTNSDAHKSETDVASQYLGMQHETLSIGPELVRNGDFETMTSCPTLNQASTCEIDGWVPSDMADGIHWSNGLFVVGLDHSTSKVNPRTSSQLRIDGIFVEQNKLQEPARAGVLTQRPITLSANSTLLIELRYATQGTESILPSIYLTTNPIDFSPKELYLPASPNHWSSVTILTQNLSSEELAISPILRLWSTGTVWFDDFSIREIRRTDGQPIPPRDPIINIQ